MKCYIKEKKYNEFIIQKQISNKTGKQQIKAVLYIKLYNDLLAWIQWGINLPLITMTGYSWIRD